MVFFHIHTQEYTHTHSNIWVLILPFQRKIQCVRFNRMPNYRFLQWVRRGGPEYACASVRERERRQAGAQNRHFHVNTLYTAFINKTRVSLVFSFHLVLNTVAVAVIIIAIILLLLLWLLLFLQFWGHVLNIFLLF